MKTVVLKIKDHLEWCFEQEDPLYHVSALLTSIDQNAVEKGECYLDQEKEQMINFAKEALNNAQEKLDDWSDLQYTIHPPIDMIIDESNIPIL